MKKTYKDLSGENFDIDLVPHDISGYEVLFHVTLKENRKSIEENGLIIGQPQHKSLVKTDLLFLSYPVNMDTGDCFRWSDNSCSLVVLDAKKLLEDGYIFYNDWFARMDQSSLRNHLCCDVNIPANYISRIVEF